MQKKYLFPLLGFFPSLIISFLPAIFVGGTIAGFMWIFIIGDSGSLDFSLNIAFILGILVYVLGVLFIMYFLYKEGKKQDENNSQGNFKVIITLVGITSAIVVLFLLRTLTYKILLS